VVVPLLLLPLLLLLLPLLLLLLLLPLPLLLPLLLSLLLLLRLLLQLLQLLLQLHLAQSPQLVAYLSQCHPQLQLPRGHRRSLLALERRQPEA